MERLGETIKGYVQRHSTILGGVSSVLNATILFVPSTSQYYDVIAEGAYATATAILPLLLLCFAFSALLTISCQPSTTPIAPYEFNVFIPFFVY